MNNSFKILNEGKISILKYKDYQMIPDYVKQFENEMLICRKITDSIIFERTEDKYTREETEIYNKWKKIDLVSMHYFHERGEVPKSDYKIIAKLMNVEPFHSCVMFNISPNWKGQFGSNPLTDKLMIKQFRKVIEGYLNEEFNGTKRYSKWEYCLENGSEGNFLHAHIVAELNPKIEKSVKTHIQKGNHGQQLKKLWDRHFEGHQGYIKGKYSIQRNLINCEEMLKDKLLYLKEENKAEGHRNKTDLGLVFGGF